MQYFVGVVFALGLVASPVSASAQDAEESATPEPSVEDPAATAEPAPEEPALQLELDDAGVGVRPSAPRTPDGPTLRRRAKRAKIGLGVSVPFIVVGTGVLVGASAPGITQIGETEENPIEPSPGGIAAGSVIAAGALGGTIASGILLRKRKLALSRGSRTLFERRGLPTRRGYTVEEAELRLKRARIGLGVSVAITVLGVALLLPGAVVGDCVDGVGAAEPWCQPLTIAGITLISAGAVAMATTGFMSLRRTRDRYWLRRARYETPRRVQWDLAGSRLVF